MLNPGNGEVFEITGILIEGNMDRSVAAETLNFYTSFSERDALQDREQGSEDGQQNYPPADSQSFSAHETYRISEARTAINKYVGRIRVELDKLDTKIRSLRSKRDEEYKSRKASLQNEKARELTLLNTTQGLEPEEYKNLISQQDSSVEAYRIEKNRAKRDAKIRLADQLTDVGWLVWLTPYIGLLGLLAILEVPINNLAVELAFEFVPPLSYIIAFLVGLTFVLMAHFAGIQILRFIDAKGALKFLHAILFLGLFLLASFMVLILFEMRGQVSNLLEGGGQLNLLQDSNLGTSGASSPLDITGRILGEDATAPAEAPLSQEAATPPANQDTWDVISAFFGKLFSDPMRAVFGIGSDQQGSEARFAQVGLLLLNALILLIGTVLSVMRHDRNADLELTFMRQKRAENQINRFVRAYRRGEAKLNKDFGEKIAEVERQADEINQDMLSLNEQREQLKGQMQNEMGYVLNTLMVQLSAYQQGNMQVRRTPAPVYFGRYGFAKLGQEVLVV